MDGAVEIDFVVGGDARERIAEVRNGVAGLGSAADDALRRLRARFAEESQALKQVELDIKNIEKAYSNAAPGAGKIELGQELSAARKALEEQKVIVADLKGQADAASAAHVSFRTQLRMMREELIAMEQAGQRGGAAYAELQKKAAQLQDAIEDVSQATRTLANDQSAFAGVVSGLSLVSGSMSAAAGAAALLGVESGNLERIQTRLQSLMAITIGLQQVSAALNKDSAFQIVAVAGAKRAWAAAVQFLNLQLGLSVGLSKALMVSGLGLLLAGAGLLVSRIMEWRRGQEAVNKANEEAKKKAEALAAAQGKLAGDYGKEKAAIEALRAALHSETLSRDKKLAIIKKLQEIIPNYNAELSKEGRVIKENTDALTEYMAALEKSLKLKAAQAELEDLYKRQYEIEKGERDPAAVEAEVQKRMPSRDVVHRQMVRSEFAFTSVKPEERKKMIDDAMAKEYSKNKADVEREAVMARTGIRLEIENIQKYIADNNLVALAKPETGAAKEKTKKEFYDASKDIEALLREINAKTQALQMQLMEDSLQKRLMLLDREEAAELQKIAEREQKIVEEYNKSHGTKYNNIEQFDASGAKKIEQEKTALTAEFAAKRVEIEKDAGIKIMDIQLAAVEQNKSAMVKQLNDITEKYKNMRRQAMSNSKDGKLDDTAAKAIDDGENAAKEKVLGTMLGQYKTYFNERKALEQRCEQDMADLQIAMQEAATAAEEDIVRASMARRKGEYSDALAAMEKEHKGKNSSFFGIGDAVKRIKELRTELAQVKLNPEAAAQAQELGEQLDRAAEDFSSKFYQAGQTAVSAIKGIAEALGTLDSGLGRTASELANVADGLLNLGMGIASGNPAQIISGALTLTKQLASWIAESRESARKAREIMEAWQFDQFMAEGEIMRLMQERQAVEDAINKARLQVIKEEQALIQQKNAELKVRNQQLMDSIAGQDYKSGQHTQTRTNQVANVSRWLLGAFGALIDPTYTVVVDDYAKIKDYLAGAKDEAEAIAKLQELNAQGKLNDQQKAMLSEMVQNQSIYNQNLQTQIELEQERKQLLTGTTASGLLDGLKQGLAAGKRAFADFANDAEGVLRNALLSAVSAAMESRAIELYNEWLASAMEDSVITAEEAEDFKKRYAQMGEDMAKQLDAFNQAGVDMGGGSTALTGAIKGITESTASLLAGQMNGIRINAVQQLERMGAILTAVQGIKYDTGQYLPYLQKLDTIAAAMQSGSERGN